MALDRPPKMVIRDDVPTSLYSADLPPFIAQHASAEVQSVATELLRITRETRVLLGEFFLYVALGRSPALSEKLKGTPSEAGVNITVASLLRVMVMHCAALFDPDPQTSNLPHIVKSTLSTACNADLSAFHRHYGVAEEASVSRGRLVKYQRAVRREPFRGAIRRLRIARNQSIAHFDAFPSRDQNHDRAVIRDIYTVVALASVIAGEANVYGLGRKVDIAKFREILRREANGLRSAIERGIVPFDSV